MEIKFPQFVMDTYVEFTRHSTTSAWGIHIQDMTRDQLEALVHMLIERHREQWQKMETEQP